MGIRSRFVRLGLVVTALLATLTACSSGSSGDAALADQVGSAVVLDVRTPEEFAAGHLEGAVNLDITAADAAAQVAALDPDASYIVYCRSGNRSASAAAMMKDAGIADVTDAGGMDAAAASTGLSVTAD